MATRKSMSVVILHEPVPADARPDELDALVQVEEVGASLDSLGWRVSTLAVDLDARAWLGELARRRPACVFNIVESLAGSGRLIAVVPSLLEASGMKFTGASADAIHLTSNKLLAKRWMAMHGLPTPAWLSGSAQADRNGGRWIVKSVWEHASLGLDDESVVRGEAAVAARLDQSATKFGGEWFAERFIEGREFNIALIEQDGMPVVLPIAEISFAGLSADKPSIVGYAAKWDPSAPEYHSTPRTYPELPVHLEERLRELALHCWRIFGLRGYARVDMRLDRRGAPWILEVNANPCLSSDAGYMAAAAMAGRTPVDVVGAIVTAALRPDRRPAESSV